MADFKDALVFPSKYGNWIDFLATLFFSSAECSNNAEQASATIQDRSNGERKSNNQTKDDEN